MKLVEEFKFNVKVAKPLEIGVGPYGQRTVIDIIGGEVTGERIRGKLLSGADWALVGQDGFLRIDVRTQIQTHDGANIFMQYQGLLELNAKLQESLAKGEPTEFGDQYCFTNPRLETGDERYSWVNRTFFVAQARSLLDGPEYRVWRAE